MRIVATLTIDHVDDETLRSSWRKLADATGVDDSRALTVVPDPQVLVTEILRVGRAAAAQWPGAVAEARVALEYDDYAAPT